MFLTILLCASFLSIEISSSYGNLVANTWEELTPMPTPRSDLGLAAVDSKIFAIGGDTRSGSWPYSGSIVGTNEEYDTEKDTWSTKAPMPTPRSRFAIAAYQGKIYCFGGISGINEVTMTVSNTIEVYNTTANYWENKTSMPTARWGLQANVVENKIYLIGGYSSNATHKDIPSTINEIYDPATDSFAIGTEMPITGGQFHSAVVDNKIHFVDFSELNSVTPLHLVYDPITDSWSQAEPDPLPSGFGAVSATTGINASKRLYAFGRTGDLWLSNSATTRIYDHVTDTWSYGRDMITKRLDFAVAVVNDAFYAIGGYTRVLDSSHLGDTLTQYANNERYLPPDYGNPDKSLPTESSPSPSIPELPVSAIFSTAILLMSIALVLKLKILKRDRLPQINASSSNTLVDFQEFG